MENNEYTGWTRLYDYCKDDFKKVSNKYLENYVIGFISGKIEMSGENSKLKEDLDDIIHAYNLIKKENQKHYE